MPKIVGSRANPSRRLWVNRKRGAYLDSEGAACRFRPHTLTIAILTGPGCLLLRAQKASIIRLGAHGFALRAESAPEGVLTRTWLLIFHSRAISPALRNTNHDRNKL